MNPNIYQSRIFARRLLWLIIGPDICKKFRFPWCEAASRPLRKIWLQAIEPPPPPPEPPPPTPIPPPPPVPPPPGPTVPPPEPPPYVPPPIYIPPFTPGPPNPTGGIIQTPGAYVLQVEGMEADGSILAYNASWDVTRNAPTNAYAWDNSGADSSAIHARFYNTRYYIQRSFLFFDLSLLPAGKTIIAAVVSVLGYFYARTNVVLQQGTQHDPIVSGDWAAFTGAPLANVEWVKSGDDPTGWNDMELNDQGRAYIKAAAGGVVKFMLREYEHDYLDVLPIDNDSRNGMFFANNATPANRPYITVIFK